MDLRNPGSSSASATFRTAGSTPSTSASALPLTDPGWNVVTNIARGQAISKSEFLQKRAQAAKDNPQEAAQKYDAARKSMFGEFSSQPITVCAPCLAGAKARSRNERLDLIAQADACGCSPDAAVGLREDMDEIENVRVAKYAYLANDPDALPELRDQPPPGFLKATDDDLKSMGLTRDMLEPDGTNFRAVVVAKDPKVWAPPDPPDPKFVLAFRGSTPELEDWENNMMQGAGKTPGYIGPDGTVNEPYYRRAVEIGKAIGKRDPSPSVQFVGHSLGGGLASAAQGGSGGASGKPASTYNAAGLKDGTTAKYGGASADPSKINAFRVVGEALTKAQEHGLTGWLAPAAVGIKQDLKPAVSKADYMKGQGAFDQMDAKKAGQSFDADAEYASYLHGMDIVIDSMEARKKANQATLQRCAKQVS